MKKIFLLLLCLIVSAAFIGCSGNADGSLSNGTISTNKVSSIIKSSKQKTSSRLTSYAFAQKTKVKIMPLGDSLTQGGQHKTSAYRGYLSTILKDEGHNSVFVGCHNWSYDSIKDGNWMHSGFGGATVESLSGSLDTMADCNPDIVLLCIGRNDNTKRISAEQTVENIDTMLVERLYEMFPDVHIYLANPPPIRVSGGQESLHISDLALTLYLPAYKQYVADKKAEGYNIDFVEMSIESTGMVWEDFTAEDFVHPLPQGYEKLAKVWYAAISDKVAEIQKEKEQIVLKGQ